MFQPEFIASALEHPAPAIQPHFARNFIQWIALSP